MGWILHTGLEVTIAICGAVYIISHWKKGKCNSKATLAGKTAIVTGANGGIGLYTAMDFAARKGRVILACRNMEKGSQARDQIIQTTHNDNVHLKYVDMSSMKSVRQFASDIIQEEERVDILVNNAAVEKTITEEGMELTWATNYFGPFLLTSLLLDKMKRTPNSRVINVTSNANFIGKIDFDNLHAEKFFDAKSYHNSKLALTLFTKELSRRVTDTGVRVSCAHPGFVLTDVFSLMPWYVRGFVKTAGRLFAKTPREGAETTIHCALSEDIEGDPPGAYYADCKMYDHSFFVNKLVYDEGLAKKLWDVSEKVVGLKSS